MEIYTDGSCWPNNGKGSGGWAYAHKNPDWTYTVCFGYLPAPTTNNIAELTAVTRAIESYPTQRIHSDSQYVVKGFNEWMKKWVKKNWKNGKVKNLDLWKHLEELKTSFAGRLIWVKGHNGNFLNDLADAAANYARKTGESGERRFSKQEADFFIYTYQDNSFGG